MRVPGVISSAQRSEVDANLAPTTERLQISPMRPYPPVRRLCRSARQRKTRTTRPARRLYASICGHTAKPLPDLRGPDDGDTVEMIVRAHEQPPVATSRCEAEGRVAISEEANVGLHPERIAVGADQEVANSVRVPPGEEHSEEAGAVGMLPRVSTASWWAAVAGASGFLPWFPDDGAARVPTLDG